jgi:hypothetical protein
MLDWDTVSKLFLVDLKTVASAKGLLSRKLSGRNIFNLKLKMNLL